MLPLYSVPSTTSSAIANIKKLICDLNIYTFNKKHVARLLTMEIHPTLPWKFLMP